MWTDVFLGIADTCIFSLHGRPRIGNGRKRVSIQSHATVGSLKWRVLLASRWEAQVPLARVEKVEKEN